MRTNIIYYRYETVIETELTTLLNIAGKAIFCHVYILIENLHCDV